MKRYLLIWLSLTATLLTIVAICNFFIDPYGLFRVVDRIGFNSIKPTAGAHSSMAKAYQVLRVQPHGLILGNSRMEVGIDPEYKAWPTNDRPIFNLSLPGSGTPTTLRYLQHVLASANRNPLTEPKVVVWGIDFMDFLINSDNTRKAKSGAHIIRASGDGRMLTNSDGTANPLRIFQEVKDYANSTFTLESFLDSAQTLASQNDPYSENLTYLGFNPMRDYVKIEADEGYWAVFRQRDRENIKAYLHRSMSIFDVNGRSSSSLDDLRQVIKLCQHYGVVLYIVIYPYHAHLLETIRLTGHWPAFETWMRTIAHIVGTETQSSDSSPVFLWDFSCFNEITMESVPPKGDRHTKMHWYWEAGHFKSELGDVMLNRIFGRSGSIPGFGVLLGPTNVEGQVAKIQAQEIDYRRSHSQDVKELERITTHIRAQLLN